MGEIFSIWRCHVRKFTNAISSPAVLGFHVRDRMKSMGSLPLPKSHQSWGTSGYPSPLIKLAILFSEIKKSGFVGKIGYPKVDGLSSSSPLKLHLGYTQFQTHPFEARLGQGLKQALDREAIISVELCSRCRASTCLQTSVGKWVMWQFGAATSKEHDSGCHCPKQLSDLIRSHTLLLFFFIAAPPKISFHSGCNRTTPG